MFYNVQKFSFSNIDKFSTASIITRLTTDVTNVQTAFQMIVRLGVRAPMSERTRMRSLVIASILVGGFIYPVFGHWVWGGIYISQPTFLSAMGYMDFAGATVVHSTAGWIALAGVIVVGPRKDRWDESGKPKRLGRSNIPFATLGTFILWFGWFGFNGGSLLKFDDKLGLILLNTNLAAAAGVVGAVAMTFLFAKDQSFMEAIFNGALGGLVAITAGSELLTPMNAEQPAPAVPG